jgi:hypothetical protein
MSLDGTGTTNLLIPNGNNRAWSVNVLWTIVVTVLGTGTTGGLAVGAVSSGTDTFQFKKVGGVASISSVTSSGNHNDAGMASANILYSVGGSNDLLVQVHAPSTAGTATTFRSTAALRITEISW